MSLFDPPTGEDLRDEALDRVEANTDSGWMGHAAIAIGRIPPRWNFTTDDIWAALAEVGVGAPHEPRAMGAAIRAAAHAGLIESTGVYLKSTRPEAHARPIPVWRRI